MSFTKITVLCVIVFLNIKLLSQSPNWLVFSHNDLGISQTAITSITEDLEKFVWIGTHEDGIIQYDGYSWTIFNSSNTPIPVNFIWTTVVDSFNNKWFGTLGNTGGLIKYDNDNWLVYNISDYGLDGSSVFSIAIDSSNNLWMGTYWDGLAMFDTDTTWLIYNSNNSGLLQPQEEINCVAIDPTELLWYGSDGYGGGVFDLDSNWTHFLPSDGVDEVLMSVGFDEEGNTWYGGQRYVTKIDSMNNVIKYQFREGGVRYFNLIPDTSNIVWFTSVLDGFLKLDYSAGEVWIKLYPEGYGLDSIGCQGLLRDNFGNFWIGYNNGSLAVYNPNGIEEITNISETKKNVPDSYRLYTNYPNPFNPTTTITYQIPKDCSVNLEVYNTLGQVVAELVNEHQTSGKYSIQFNAINLPSAVYIYKLISGNYSSAKKMILAK